LARKKPRVAALTGEFASKVHFDAGSSAVNLPRIPGISAAVLHFTPFHVVRDGMRR
jgi:hypothetical protein